MLRDRTARLTKEVQKIQQTFAHVYETVQKEALSHFTRRKMIEAEFFKYKNNMDLKNTRPKRLQVACLVVVVSMVAFLGYRIFHMALALEIDFWFGITTGVYSMLVAYVIIQQFIVSYFFYRDPYQKARLNPLAMQYNPKVSVVIATKNERFVIFDAAHSALNSSYKNLEVCIVNDGSDDNFTAQNIDELVKHNNGRVRAKHLARNEGKRRAMRHGFYLSEGEIIIFLDSDTIVEHDAIERLVRCMNDDPNLGAIVGYCRPLNANQNWLTLMQDGWYHSAYTVGKGMEHTLGTVSCCSGILSAYRREGLEPCIDRWAVDIFLGKEFVAGDDRQLTAYIAGGNKWNINKNLKQWRTGYCESALSISETPYKFKKFIRQQIRWEQSWVRVMLFTFPFWWHGRNPLVCIDYYLRMALSYLAPIIAVLNLVVAPLTGQWLSTVIYLGGLFCLSLLFCMDYILYNPDQKRNVIWRIAFTFLSVGTLYFLLYYSVYTVLKRQNDWLTR